MSNPPPTFRSHSDRLVYLLAEYRIPLSVMILAGGVWVSWARPELPTPPESVVSFSIAAGILAVPTYAFGLKVAKYLFDPPGVVVAVADPGTNGEDGQPSKYQMKRVPPEVWAEKSVVGAAPLVPEEGADYVVTRFVWYDDLGELEVRGCDQADLPPGEAWENAERVDEVYLHHQDTKRSYSRLKATVSRYATEIHDATVMMMMAEDEEARLSPDVSVTSLIEEMEGHVDSLPNTPQGDHQPQHVRQHGLGQFDGDLPDEPGIEKQPAQPMMNDGGREQ